jgi:hypothetical protein
MASRYPISELIDRAKFFGMRTPFDLPAGFRPSTDRLPSHWVLDPSTNMVMPAEKHKVLTRERLAYRAEQRAQHLASARMTVRELESEQKRLTGELLSFVGDLEKAVHRDPDDLPAIFAITHNISDRARSRASTMSALIGQRQLIQDLSAKATHAGPEPDDKASQ